MVAAGTPEPLAAILADADAGAAAEALHDDRGMLGRLIRRPTTPLRDAVATALREAVTTASHDGHPDQA